MYSDLFQWMKLCMCAIMHTVYWHKNTLFSEEAHCGCTQLREAASIPRRGCSCSQGASTTKWTHTSLQPGRYRHSATLMNTDGNTWSSLLFFFFFSFNHLHKCTQAPMSTHSISKPNHCEKTRGWGYAGGTADNMSFLGDKKPAESRSSGLFCCHLFQLPWRD